MTRVLIVCVAGVSSTFLARALRRAAPELQARITELDALPEAVPGADAVLVAPQLEGSLDGIRETVADVPVALLPASVYPADAESVLTILRRLLGVNVT